jgi:hypothetical protein
VERHPRSTERLIARPLVHGIGLSLQRRDADCGLVLSRPLALLSAVLTDLMAGGMVLIEVVLVPFWRGAPPADFQDRFAAHSGRIRHPMIPLGAGAGTVGAASATHLAEGPRSAPASLAAAPATASGIGITGHAERAGQSPVPGGEVDRPGDHGSPQ